MASPGPNGSNQSGLARFAFNIYGSLNERPGQRVPEKLRLAPSKKLKYVCDREITCVSQLHHPLARLNASYDSGAAAPAHHVIVGGKNYLKLLALDAAETQIVADFSLLDPGSPFASASRLHSSSKLFNANTVKSHGDLVACGLTSGNVHIYQISNSGKSKLARRLDDHKRVVNSLDFTDHEQVLLSGSQDGTIRLWDLRAYSPKPVVKLSGAQHSDPVRSCQYSPHNKVRGKMAVLSVHDSGALCKYDLRYPAGAHANSALPERKWTFHTGPALSLHIHPELEYVLTGGRDKKICLWNYGDSAPNSAAPETTLNTYGPVMKIRWNETPNEAAYVPEKPEASDEWGVSRPALYNYDFACSYLNDDPSISVFNLARKYVPKEIVNTLSRKPFQNFVWARGGLGDRRLWTITKSNVFVSYDLDSPDETAQNISRPSETLPAIATAWRNGFTDLAVVSQDPGDYDLVAAGSVRGRKDSLSDLPERPVSEEFRAEEYDHGSAPMPSPAESAGFPGRSFQYSQAPQMLQGTQGSHPSVPTYFYSKAAQLSPIERPSLLRSATQHVPQKPPLPLGFHRTHTAEFTMGQPSVRPGLNRNPSQNTIESTSSGNTFHGTPGSHAKGIHGLAAPSPYLVSMSVPIPSADESAFAALANDYLTSVPEGFTLSFVCQINARVAASVHRLRDCQTWRMIAVALEQTDPEAGNPFSGYVDPDRDVYEPEVLAVADTTAYRADDAKSISSDLGNVVGSYNSDSTSTSNYGMGPRKRSNASSTNNLSILGSSRDSGRDHLLRLSKPSSFQNLTAKNETWVSSSHASSPIASRRNSNMNRRLSQQPKEGKETFHEETAAEAAEAAKISVSRLNHVFSEDEASMSVSPNVNNPSKSIPIPSPGAEPPRTFHDLDNENLNFLTNASGSYSSPAYSPGKYGLSFGSRDSVGSMRSAAGRNLLKHRPILSSPPPNKIPLDKVDESSIQSIDNQESQLTKAIKRSDIDGLAIEPWHAVNIIRKSLEYSVDAGDLVMSSTLILLFYGFLDKVYAERLLEPENCLEVLGMYIEALRKREMYTVAVQVVKDCPAALQAKLSAYAVKDVEMRFYCCWCKTLLTNEMSKAKHGVGSDKFGFWYCDECSRKQSNCVYCHEPCKGLTVVESLRCGHRGHFGCFQEWHIEDGNSECPGGCE